MEPHIQYNKDGSLSSLVGKEAVELMRVATIIMGIKADRAGMKITRGATMKRMLEMAGDYTGVKYKRKDADKAITDLKVWLETMKSSIPSSTAEG